MKTTCIGILDYRKTKLKKDRVIEIDQVMGKPS